MTLPRKRTAVSVLFGALFLLVPLAPPAAAAPPPDNSGPAVSTTAFGLLDVFSETPGRTLVHYQQDATGTAPAEDLGGALRSGPAAVTIGSEFASTWAFVTGTDGAVWYRQFSDGRGTWGPWATIGGLSLTSPAASCTGDATAQPIVYVVGRDGSLWRKRLAGGGWSSLGGLMGSAPAAVPAVGGVCPTGQDLFVRGDNGAVYENRTGTWTRIGGLTFFAPTAVQLASGRTELYVVGTNGALYSAARAPGSVGWSSFVRIGGVLTSSPAAQLWQSSPQLRVVVGRGRDGRLWRGTNAIGTGTWRWVPIA